MFIHVSDIFQLIPPLLVSPTPPPPTDPLLFLISPSLSTAFCVYLCDLVSFIRAAYGSVG